MVNIYYDEAGVAREVAAGRHREVVGGMWDAIGRLQLDFLIARGLDPHMRVVDIGCGSLRAGVHLVRYLDAGRYYGVDVSQALLDAGYDVELRQAALQHKLPRDQLLRDEAFRVGRFGVDFDVALAQSVFTHLPWNHLRLCLERLAPAMRPDGVLYATFFVAGPGESWADPLVHDPGGVTTYPDRDPFHYRFEHVAAAAAGLPWETDVVGDWDHPRDQRMVTFRRVG